MKRWQDRGEVLDSDDEEFTESQSQERVPKKPRLTEDAQYTDGFGDEKVRSYDAAVQQHEGQDESGEQMHASKPDEEWPQTGTEITYEGKPIKEADTSEVVKQPDEQYQSEYNNDSAPVPSSHPTLAKQPLAIVSDIQNSQSGQSESLPDIFEVLARNNDRAHVHKTHHGSGDSTAASSALSEPEVSPTPPSATFRFPRLGPSAGRDVSHERSDEDDVLQPPPPDAIPEEIVSAATGRRNLRARKEKQLHPYLFDKAQHQKQFRERGIRPFRYDPSRKEAAETQEVSLSGNDDDSDRSFIDETVAREELSSELGEDLLSKHAAGNSRPTSQPDAVDSDEELPELTSPFRQPINSSTQHGIKRRKHFHPARPARPASLDQPNTASVQTLDEFSIPPSPPPTSSDSTARAVSRAASGNFRMPRGLTPQPLPTPQISSELRDKLGSAGSADESETGLPSRRSRPSTASRSRLRPIAMDSSTESSEAEPEVDMDNRRLKRERKRIKGVLPASWLKIDFRAQQNQTSPSPRRARRQSSLSPVRTAPQRGVAQRVVSKTAASLGRQDAVTISDDQSEEEWSKGSPSPPEMRQLKLLFERERETTVPSEFVDDERMEVDWIDPMVTGSSRPRSKQKKHNKRQPRITESFGNQLHGRTDFSEERKAIRWAVGAKPLTTKSETRRTKRRLPKRPAAPRLSIIDAPEQANSAVQNMPQFVRVAMRRARMQSDRGRHSPTNKHIRLATRDDTEDATSVLRSWREGTILPHQVNNERYNNDVLRLATDDASEEERFERRGARRTPLAEVHHNEQKKLPAPLQKQVIDRGLNPSSATTARGPRMRQTQLRPVILSNEDTAEKQDASHESISTQTAGKGNEQRRRPLLVHAQPIRYRGAQLESLEGDFGKEHRAAAFECRMHCLTENVVRHQRELGKGFQLARFLHNDASVPDKVERAHDDRNEFNAKQQKANTEAATRKITLPRRPRKRQPHRIDAEAREYRQPSEPLPDKADLERAEQELSAAACPILHGLGSFGTRYATDFDILPLPLGTYFHHSSFIGSGDFAASLNFGGRNLDSPIGHIQVHIDGEVLEWGAWTEDVAVGLSRVPGAVSNALQSINSAEEAPPDQETLILVLANVNYLLHSTVRYFTRCLAFLDPVDRRQCIHAMHRLTEDLLEVLSEHESKRNVAAIVLARCLQYVLVLSRQQLGLCDHSLVPPEARTRTRELLLRATSRLSGHIVPIFLQDLRWFYEENRHASKREAGIRDTDAAICSVVILHHATRDLENMQSPFWSMIYRAFGEDCSAMNTAHGLDKTWYDIFTMLPALEIDANGILQPGSRFQDLRGDWSLPKCLVQRLFELYPSTCLTHGSTINEYFRATLTRCSHLISRWGWWRCEPVLGAVFDFFARRGLAQLHKEKSRGSPRFLEEIHKRPALEVQAEDRSFHIFLKMLAFGLQGMQKHAIYSDQKIGGIAWRFIPNHGRTHRKDTELRQEDLDALRNHHDLLCTIYYSAPPGHRLRVDLVQNLVDHSVSHREASRLNIRAWAILASFQTSTDESDGHLEDFCLWYRDIMSTTINQYHLAKREVEHEITSARAQGKPEPSSEIVEDIIARNQRQVAATLVDILAGLKRALQSSRNIVNAIYLLNGSVFCQVYDLFDPSARRLYGVLHEALNTVGTALDIQRRFGLDVESQHGSEDSQDYGDSTALQQLASAQTASQSPGQSVVNILHAPLSQLVSNVFGADATTDDALLTKLVDIWVQLAQCTVRGGQRKWPSYISDYSSDAWTQLRETEQRRKYTAYFLSRVVDIGYVDLAEAGILTSWFQSLVEREATLKFQHVLTSALLNRHPHEQLLRNLPFSCHIRGRYDISLQEFRQRRVALISSIFSTMRENFDNTLRERPSALQELRQTYAAMLRQLMQAMKNNYQELQASRSKEVADAQAEGMYVVFVHQVVSFLQQYATDICPVDRFFTDSAVFPLPATDPTYVVGRLRSYVPKLSENRKRKELAVFLQTVSERAAVDGKQAYLVDQLVSAMAGVIEHGNARAPSLRQVLCSAIFPAYIENSLSTACSWIIALPILETCCRIADDLIYCMKVQDCESVRTVGDTMGILLQSAAHPVRAALTHLGGLSLPHVQTTLSAVFNFVRSCLTCMKFLEKTRRTACSLTSIVACFYGYASYIEAYLNDTHEDGEVASPPMDANFCSSWPETLDIVRKQVHEKFANEWYAHDGQCYVRRGNHSVEVVANFGDEERSHLLAAVIEFRQSYEVIFDGQRRTQHSMEDVCNVGAVIV